MTGALRMLTDPGLRRDRCGGSTVNRSASSPCDITPTPPHERTRSYAVLDECGQPVGIIVAPETEPVLGKHAPTFYMQRRSG